MEELISFKLSRTEFERVVECLNNVADYFAGKAVRALLDNNNEEYFKNNTEKQNIYLCIDRMNKSSKRGK